MRSPWAAARCSWATCLHPAAQARGSASSVGRRRRRGAPGLSPGQGGRNSCPTSMRCPAGRVGGLWRGAGAAEPRVRSAVAGWSAPRFLRVPLGQRRVVCGSVPVWLGRGRGPVSAGGVPGFCPDAVAGTRSARRRGVPHRRTPGVVWRRPGRRSGVEWAAVPPCSAGAAAARLGVAGPRARTCLCGRGAWVSVRTWWLELVSRADVVSVGRRWGFALAGACGVGGVFGAVQNVKVRPSVLYTYGS